MALPQMECMSVAGCLLPFEISPCVSCPPTSAEVHGLLKLGKKEKNLCFLHVPSILPGYTNGQPWLTLEQMMDSSRNSHLAWQEHRLIQQILCVSSGVVHDGIASDAVYVRCRLPSSL
ncbi:uncharacterized [Tachysurus ichikawai]